MDSQQVHVEKPTEEQPATMSTVTAEPAKEEKQVTPLVPRIPPNATLEELLLDQRNLRGVMLGILQKQLEPARHRLELALLTHARLQAPFKANPLRIRVRSAEIEAEWMGNKDGLAAASEFARRAVDDAIRLDRSVRDRHKSYADALKEVELRITQLKNPEAAAPDPVQEQAPPAPEPSS